MWGSGCTEVRRSHILTGNMFNNTRFITLFTLYCCMLTYTPLPAPSHRLHPSKRSGANPQPEGFPFGSPHRRCDEKKNDFWTRRVGSEADMCTLRVHPTRRVVFTSRGAKRRVRCEKKNSRTRRVHSHAHVHGADSAHKSFTRSVHPKGENSRSVHPKGEIHAPKK